MRTALVRLSWLVFLLPAWLVSGSPASAQVGSGGPVVANSTVGYIDNSIPTDLLRYRFDDAFNNIVPSRGAFFYARSPTYAGQQAETKVNYQELSAYAEKVLGTGFSVFAEIPVRFLNPTIDENAWGLSDINVGFKWAFYQDDDRLFSFQLRGYAPTGNGNLGLGTSHPSLEPALLGYSRLTEHLRTEGELRLLVPLSITPTVPGAISGGSSDFASTVFRFGLGMGYDIYESDRLVISPVVETVGWVFLNGKKTVDPLDGPGVDVSAAGDTIVNLKVGTRFKLRNVADLYLGYGRSLTGEWLYRDIYRFELRFPF